MLTRSTAPFFVYALHSDPHLYHRIADKINDRYLTRCDLLLARYVVTYYPPAALTYCPRCAALYTNPFVELKR